MSFAFPRRVRLSKCAKNFTLPAEVRHGWVAVRELIYQGARPVFRLASSEQRALELKEETLWTRAHKQGKAYVKKHPGYALSHGDRISGAHHLA